MDIFAANERGPNFLYLNNKNRFYNVSTEYNTDDVLQNGRGTTLSDFLYRGSLDIINGNWKGFIEFLLITKLLSMIWQVENLEFHLEYER